MWRNSRYAGMARPDIHSTSYAFLVPLTVIGMPFGELLRSARPCEKAALYPHLPAFLQRQGKRGSSMMRRICLPLTEAEALGRQQLTRGGISPKMARVPALLLSKNPKVRIFTGKTLNLQVRMPLFSYHPISQSCEVM